MVYEQNTMPIPPIRDTRPTFRQFQERYGLKQYDVARQANIRVLFVYCMERGGKIEFTHALSLMKVLSKYAGYPVRLEEMQGIHLKNSVLQALVCRK